MRRETGSRITENTLCRGEDTCGAVALQHGNEKVGEPGEEARRLRAPEVAGESEHPDPGEHDLEEEAHGACPRRVPEEAQRLIALMMRLSILRQPWYVRISSARSCSASAINPVPW